MSGHDHNRQVRELGRCAVCSDAPALEAERRRLDPVHRIDTRHAAQAAEPQEILDVTLDIQPSEADVPRRIWKSTIVIYSPYNPKDLELSSLARRAEEGDCFCPLNEAVVIDPSLEPDFPFEFFQVEDDGAPEAPGVPGGRDAALDVEVDPEDSDGRWCANCLMMNGDRFPWEGHVVAVVSFDANSGRFLCQSCEPNPVPA